MTTFADTSALYSLLDVREARHSRAVERFTVLAERDALITHNYVVVECATLIQRRLGPAALRVFFDDLMPSVALAWIDAEVHASAVSATLASADRNVSLVDRVSFEFMRRAGIRTAFAFDKHFRKQGFETVP